MKKTFIIISLFCSFAATAQVYQNDPAYGRSIARYEVLKDLGIPTFCGEPTVNSTVTNKAKIAYDSCGGIFYIFNPSTQLWSTISASAALSQQDGLISGGIVTYSGSGLTYYVSSALYRIGGQLYSSPFATITLDPADGTNSRIDLFAVDTTGHAVKITGTAATIPLAPQPDPASQIGLTTGIKLAPGATTPPEVTSLLIYDENTEWSTSATATANFDNLANPFHGVKGIYVSSYSKNSTISFLGTSKTVDVESVLRTFIYLNNANYSFQFRFYNGSTAVSNAVTLTSSFGFNSGLYNVYQNISIPLSSFTWTGTTYDKLVVTMTGRGATGQFYMDYISVEGGTPVIPATDFSNKVDSTSTKKINDSTYVGLYWIKGFSFQRGDTIKIHSTGSSTTDTASLSNRINLKKDKTDSTNTISGYTTLYQNSLNQKKTDSINVSRLNGGKIDTSHIPQTTIKVHYPLWAFDTDSIGLRTDSMPRLNYASAIRDTTGWTNNTLIDKGYLNQRISEIPSSGGGGGGTGKVYAGGHLANTNDSTLNADTLATNLRNEIALKQDKITLTTTGTSGAATLTGSTLNIPQYSGGGSTDTTSLSNRINKKQQNLGWVNVMDYGADSTGATDNYTAFTAAQTALGGHGTLFIPKGTYLFTQTFVVSSNIIIRGEGMGKNHGNYSVTKIVANTNIDLWKITAAGVQITDVGFEYTNATVATSARGLYVYDTDSDVALHQPDVSQKLILRNVSVRAFYKNIYIEKCAYWDFYNVDNINAVSVGLHVENTTLQDAGDWSISGGLFFQPMSTPGGIALEQTGSGGGKIANVKFNGAWNYCIWDSLPNSVILLVSNCSFENFVYEAIHAVSVSSIKISGCEFAPFRTISGAAIVYLKKSNGIVANNIFTGFAGVGNLALKLDTCTKMTAGLNNFNGFTSSAPYLISGGSSNAILDFNGSHYTINVQGTTYMLDPGTQTVTYGTTTTFDASLGKSAYVNLTGNTTLAISNFNEGDYLTLVVQQDATGGRTMVLPSGVKVINGGLGTVLLSTTGGTKDILCFTKILGVIYCTVGSNYN